MDKTSVLDDEEYRLLSLSRSMDKAASTVVVVTVSVEGALVLVVADDALLVVVAVAMVQTSDVLLSPPLPLLLLEKL